MPGDAVPLGADELAVFDDLDASLSPPWRGHGPAMPATG